MSPPNPQTEKEPVGLAPVGANRHPVTTSKVQVVNPCWNGLKAIRRKDAEFYVHEGRAKWTLDGKIILIDSHPKNRMAAARAAGEDAVSLIERRALAAEAHQFTPCPVPVGWFDEPVVNVTIQRRTDFVDGKRKDSADHFPLREVGVFTNGMVGAKAPIKIEKCRSDAKGSAQKHLSKCAQIKTGAVALAADSPDRNRIFEPRRVRTLPFLSNYGPRTKSEPMLTD